MAQEENSLELLRQSQNLIQKLSSALELAHVKVQELTPKAEFYDAVTNSDNHFEMSEVAKVLNYPDMGRNKLFEFLREVKILRDNNQPYQQYVDAGYFRLIEQKVTLPYGETILNLKTVVSQTGLDYIRRKLNERFTTTEN